MKIYTRTLRGGCSSVGRAGGLVIRRSLVRIPAPLGGTELHVEVSLSKILDPKVAPDVQMAPCVAATAISKGPAMSWQLCSLCELDLAP